MAIRRAWSRFGALPALPFVVAFFALALAAAAALDGAASGTAGGVLVAILIAYCVARPADGRDLFFFVAAPNALGQLAQDTVGAPQWIFVALLPIALLGAWGVDRETRRAPASSSAPTTSPTPAGPPGGAPPPDA